MLTSYRIWKTLAFFFWARADYLSFRPQRTCDCKTIQSHLKAQNFPMFGKFSAFNHRVFILLLPHLPSMELLKLVKESGSYSPPSFFRISDEVIKVMGSFKGSVQFSLRNFSQTSFLWKRWLLNELDNLANVRNQFLSRTWVSLLFKANINFCISNWCLVQIFIPCPDL